MEVGVLALQGDFAEHSRALAEVGADPRRVKRPDELNGIAAIVLPGGESTTLGMLLDSSELRDPLGKLISDGLPVFATCAGMILLASHIEDGRPDQRTFGALDIDVRRNGYGRQLESFETELDVEGLSEPLPAVFIRAPVVVRTGRDVEVLARVAERDAAPALVRQGPVLAAAFHPELTDDRRLHRMFVDMIKEKGR